MDELDRQINIITESDKHKYDCTAYGEGQACCLEKPEIIEQLKQAIKDAGYIHIPSSQGKNVTIYTSDSDEPLLTEAEWFKHAIAKQWLRPYHAAPAELKYKIEHWAGIKENGSYDV